MKKLLLGMTAVLLAGLLWLLEPVYQFYAHRGMAPLPPTGWQQINGTVPESQQLFDPDFAARGQRALDAIRDYRQEHNLPALSVAVARGDGLVWTGTVGFADIAAGTPMAPDTLFRIGSTSKAITATALARLVERGEIDLDAPLSTYLSPLPNPAWGAITPRQLASHAAGVPHYGENGDTVGLYRSIAMQRHYNDVRDALAVFDGSPLLHPPGTAFHYSSLGTVLLGATMSEVAGLPYRDLVTREVLEPAGMSSTFADGDEDERNQRVTQLYYTDGERFRPWREVDLSHRLPGGGFISSPSDLARMGLKYFDPDYLAPATRDRFWTPQRLADGRVNEQDYALGWRWREWDIDGVGVVRNANHGGVARGSQCWLLVLPDQAMSMAFCTNVKTDSFSTFGGVYKPLVLAFMSPAA
jgi:CubicO group peptidase (beta-lactamase class C family)